MNLRIIFIVILCWTFQGLAQSIDSAIAEKTDSTDITSSPDTGDTGTLPLVPESGISENAAPLQSIPLQINKATVRLHASIQINCINDSGPVIDLSIDDAVNGLLEHNPEIKRARLEWMASMDKYQAAFGNFEPALVSNYKTESIDRPSVLIEQTTNTFTSGIEGTLPTATKYSLNFSFLDVQYRFSDNLNKPNVFSGVTLTQPLLQGLWFGKPVSDLKAGAIEKNIALHKYRAALCAKIFEVQNSYWKLCYAQKVLEFAAKSVAIAKEIADDGAIQVRAGKISHIQELEATAGLSTRLTNFSDAQKDRISAMNDLKLLIADNACLKDTLVRALTPLTVPAGYRNCDYKGDTLTTDAIMRRQPDYLQQKFLLEKEKVVFDNQKDQCMPELNVKGTYGYLVLGNTTDKAWDGFSNTGYRLRSCTYSAEIELRVPLGTNIKERNLLYAQKRSVRSAEVNMQSLQMQLENYINTAHRRIAEILKNLSNAYIVVSYRETLLNAEIMRQKAGKSDFRKIFEIEEDLTKSRQLEMENLLDYKSTMAELARLTGTILIDNNLETMEKGRFILNKKLTQ
jgi:outer membrane protein TolC